MPKFIGNRAPEGAIRLPQDNEPRFITRDLVPLNYAQMRKVDPTGVRYSLDTTDRGGIRSMAKRWYRWFATPGAILRAPSATRLMRAKANIALTEFAP